MSEDGVEDRPGRNHRVSARRSRESVGDHWRRMNRRPSVRSGSAMPKGSERRRMRRRRLNVSAGPRRPEWSGPLKRSGSWKPPRREASLLTGPADAADEVVVHAADRLQMGIADRGAEEFEASFLHVFADRVGQRGRSGNLAQRFPMVGRRGLPSGRKRFR